MDVTKFEELQLDDRIIRAITEMGFEEASPIQAQAIPVVLEGRDMIGQAQTGTGKTAAFGLPLLQKVDPKVKKLQAVVLLPICSSYGYLVFSAFAALPGFAGFTGFSFAGSTKYFFISLSAIYFSISARMASESMRVNTSRRSSSSSSLFWKSFFIRTMFLSTSSDSLSAKSELVSHAVR